MIMVIRTLAWFLILTLYWAMDWLNFLQALKSALLGSLFILALSAWTLRDGLESRVGRLLNLLVVFLFLVLSGFHSFLRDVFGVAQDDVIVVEAIFNTNSGESSEFILQNFWSLGKHLLIVILAAVLYWFLLAWRPVLFRRFSRAAHSNESGRSRIITIPAVLFTGLLILAHLNPTLRKENPLLYFPIRHAKWERSVESTRVLQDKITAAVITDSSLATMSHTGKGPRTVVFLIGESVTRLNWSMYGYSRKTTPELESLGPQLLRFSDVVTTLGSTVGDIRLMIGPATRERPELYSVTPDILTMASKAGYKTFWITNHSTDISGSLAIIAGHADVTINVNRGGSRGEGSHDEVIFPEFSKALDDPAPRKFIILHLLQAHPAFYFRYPESFSRFNDEDDVVARTMRSDGRSLRARKMRNYYDNAMLYSDHILKATIDLCAARPGQPISWLFVPDHGEDVGHYSNFVGHNNRVPAMFEIPFLFWKSDRFPLALPEKDNLLTRAYQTDLIDHTLLGLMEIEGDYYDPSHNVLSPDFEPTPRTIAGKPYP
ncbi:MAG: sulfatase-like hydrolase/transferase [bacterium]|nr:sulfatase-like hydrolase/transferase [bacterium]MDT8367211.1 sulfatase-like hydrolase/transferase [bacterium]